MRYTVSHWDTDLNRFMTPVSCPSYLYVSSVLRDADPTVSSHRCDPVVTYPLCLKRDSYASTRVVIFLLYSPFGFLVCRRFKRSTSFYKCKYRIEGRMTGERFKGY